MKKICLIAGITLAGLLALGLTKASFARRRPSGRSRRVLIGFKDGTGPQAAERRRAYVRERGGRVHRSYRYLPAAAAELSESQISRLRADPRVAYIEEDGEVHALTELDDSWGVKHIGAGDVHPNNKGAGINVAIIDTGINYGHPDLNDNYKGGYDFVNEDDDPMDDNGHGTHCAGIVAAEDNGEGVIGVAPEASLYAVKVLDSGGSGYLSDVVAGIEWAIVNNMDIISMSLSTNYNYQTLRDACDKAYDKGILLVAAAGNDYRTRRGIERDTVDYPARYDSVIAVGATNDADVKASWSSTGSALELAAPGVNIYSTYLGNSYTTKSGTSMACPHVAGTAALIWSGSNDGVRAILQDTADDLGDSGWDKWYGYGLVDADETAGVVSEPPVLTTVEVSPASVTLYVGQTQEFTATGKDQYGDPIDTGTITWQSSDEGVGTINSGGLFTAGGVGDTAITATGSGGVFGTAGVTVQEAAVLTTIEVSPSNVTLYIDESQLFTATGKDQYGDPIDTGTITWQSSDEGVGTINSITGVFEAVGAGPTTVSATSGYVVGTADVTVQKLPVLTTIEVSPSNVTLYIDESQPFTATGKDQYGDPIDTGTITWQSSDEGVGTINSGGLFTAGGVGDTAITATGSGGVFGTASVTVEGAPSELTVFFDSFESSYDWTANWSQDTQNDWRRRTARKIEGNYAAEVDGRATDAQLISKDIDLQGRSNATISFWWFIERGLDAGEYLAFDVSADGGVNWAEMASLNGNADPENTWHYEEFELTGISSLKIQFRGKMSSSREDAYVDVVEVIAW